MVTLSDLDLGAMAPLGVWDVDLPHWFDEHWRDRCEWANRSIPDVDRTYRVEFYLMDAPLAVLYRYAQDEDGHVLVNLTKDGPLHDPPVIQLLGELPPRHLL